MTPYEHFSCRIHESDRYIWYAHSSDGNPRNISIENMRFYSMRLHGKHTGHLSKSRAVVIKDFKKDPIRYRSVREAAKALYCSYQTLLDYLNGSVRKSVLNKWGRKIYYEVI
jgi:hypothetical protein